MKGAIIVPYRNRYEHLQIFILHMRNYVPGIPITVIEQCDEKGFNRGKLLNIGYLEVDADYYVQHDVDLIPIQADYSYPKQPTHIATELEQFDYKMPFKEYFGGVTLFNKLDFKKINGYTNEIFGWGLEDTLIRRELHWKGMKIQRRRGVFNSLPHERPQDYNSPEYKLNEMRFMNGRKSYDGVNNCKYTVIEKLQLDGYDVIKVIL